MDVNFSRVQARVKELKILHAVLTIGSSGAVTLSESHGISSVVKESAAGRYTITLIGKANKLLNVSVNLVNSSIESAGMTIASDTVATNGKLIVQFSKPTSASDTTPVAANLSSGTKVLVEIKIKNSGVAK